MNRTLNYSQGQSQRVPTEFGHLVDIKEAEQQMLTHYEVFPERPNDLDLLLSAVEWPLIPGPIPLSMS